MLVDNFTKENFSWDLFIAFDLLGSLPMPAPIGIKIKLKDKIWLT